jgi:hypothetical protein
VTQDDYEFIKQEMTEIFGELNHRMCIRSGEDFLLTPEVDKLAKDANWMLKAWRICFEYYKKEVAVTPA